MAVDQDEQADVVHPYRSTILSRIWGALPGWVPRTLVAPLLASVLLTLALMLFYALPWSTGLGWSQSQVAAIGAAFWLVALLGWAATLRQAASGWRLALARTSTGHSLKAVDAAVWLALIGLVVIGPSNPVLTLLAWVFSFSYLVLLVAPARDVTLEQLPEMERHRVRRTLDPTARPDEKLSDDYTLATVSWDLGPLGVNVAGQTDVVVNLDRLNSMRRLNPESPAKIRGVPYGAAAINEWIVRGTTEEVDRLTVTLSGVAADQRFNQEQKVMLALAVAQGIPYVKDRDSVGKDEYWRYPIESLVDQEGDCEDSTILAAAILRRMGFDVAMIFTKGHAALGVAGLPGAKGHFVEHDGRDYMYCETTGTGWRVGQLPPDIDLKTDLEEIAPAAKASLAGVRGD